MTTFRVRWADLNPMDDRVLVYQSKRMARVASLLKRDGFVLSETDPDGFAVYRQDGPAPKRRRMSV